MIEHKALLGLVRSYRAMGKKNDNLSTIVLWHCNRETGAERTVDSWDLDDPNLGNDDQLTAVMEDIANRDSQSLGDVQEYMFCFYFGQANANNSRGGYGARYAFKMHGAPSFDDVHSDPSVTGGMMGATEKGIAKIATGHVIDIMRMALPAIAQTQTSLMNQISRLEEQNNKLMAERGRMVVMQEKMISQKFKRDIMWKKYLFWEDQKAKAAEIFLSIAPSIVMGLAHRPMLGPAPRTETTNTFEEFIASLESHQMASIQPKLKPHQLPMVMLMMQGVKSGQGIQPAILKQFLQTLDEPQLDGLKEVLQPNQHALLIGALRHAMKEHDDAQNRSQNLRKGIEREDEADPALHDVDVNEDEPS